jgi:hypothetical protein
MNIVLKNNIIIISFCILGFFLYTSETSRTNKEDKLLFLVGYVIIMILIIYLLNKPSRMNKEQRK